MKTPEEIQRRIDYLTKKATRISKYDHKIGYPDSTKITPRSKRFKRRSLPITKLRIKEKLAYIEGKLRVLRWVLK